MPPRKIAEEILAHIRANPNSFIGVSLRANAGQEIRVRFVNREYGTDYDRHDMVAALKHLVEIGEMREVGAWGVGLDNGLYSLKT